MKPINGIIKKSNKLNKLNKISPLPPYAEGKGVGKCKSPDIQGLWIAEHTKNFALIKKCFLECDSSAKHVGSVLYQEQNGRKQVVAFFSAVMQDPACRYSSSEIELCVLKKAILYFQYLLKYANFNVIMDHSALKFIYNSKKPAKTNRIQNYL